MTCVRGAAQPLYEMLDAAMQARKRIRQIESGK